MADKKQKGKLKKIWLGTKKTSKMIVFGNRKKPVIRTKTTTLYFICVVVFVLYTLLKLF